MEHVFVAMLQAQAAITALVGSGANARIYPLVLPQDPTYPAITYQIISAPREYTQQGRDGVVTFRVQMDAYSHLYDEVKQVRDALDNEVSGLFNEAFGSPAVVVQGCFIMNERDRFESAIATEPPGGVYRKSLDLAVTLKQP